MVKQGQEPGAQAPKKTRAPKKNCIEQQRRFAQEYALDGNATQAAIRAGYSPRSAHDTGHRLLKVPDVQAIIQEIRKSEAKKYENERDAVMAELRAMAFHYKYDMVKLSALKLLGEKLGMWGGEGDANGTGDGGGAKSGKSAVERLLDDGADRGGGE